MNYIDVFTNSLSYKLKKAQQSVQEDYLRRTAEFGLTPTQVYVLCILRDKKLVKPSEFSALLRISRPSATTLLNRMERDKLLHRLPDKVNRRQVWVVATKKGLGLMQKAHASLAKEETTLRGLTPADIKELKQLLDTLSSDTPKPIEEDASPSAEIQEA